jgi:hypothetical protein
MIRLVEADLFGWMSYINEHEARFAQCLTDSLTLFIGCAESDSISFLKSDANIAKCEEWLLKFRSDTISSPRPWLLIEDGTPIGEAIAIEDGTHIRGASGAIEDGTPIRGASGAIQDGTPIRGARVQAHDQQRKAAEKNSKQDMLLKIFTPTSEKREARSAIRRGLSTPPVCVGSERGKRPEAVGTQRRSTRRLGAMPSGPTAFGNIVNTAENEVRGKSSQIKDIKIPQIE